MTISQTVEFQPSLFQLKQNYPNPFKGKTIIGYTISYKSNVRIIIRDSYGRIVERLDSKSQNAGTYEVEFDSSNLPEGIYFYQIITDCHTETRSMIIL